MLEQNVFIITSIISFLLSVPFYYNIVSWYLDFMHLQISFFSYGLAFLIIYDMIIKGTYDFGKLLIINCMFFGMIIGISIYGMCPYTILYNKAMNQPIRKPFLWSIKARVDKAYAKSIYSDFLIDNDDGHKNTLAWLKNQKWTVIILFILNIVFALHIS